ncbi:MAG: hypothetical protein COA96_16190 [SAR86 cluster bacterium]|uniref:Uncharacterized protein n=1 Tax=SAR86 cluster bacterium TaxID=2030880 RepID=A0A2A5ALF5_9GAMM|nr:MAG: hypothetical protein COA96_16190 [SAR86 cluster bacterium]
MGQALDYALLSIFKVQFYSALMLPRLKLHIDPKHSFLLSGGKKLLALFPLTLQGVITLSLSAYVLSVYGYGAMDLVVFSLAVCALTILIFSLFSAVICGILIQRKIQQRLKKLSSKPIKLEAGFPNETGFSLPAINYLPLVKLSWQIVFPDFIETRVKISHDNQLIEEVVPIKRCKTSQVTRRFVVSDVLGFCRYSWQQVQEVSCTALPKTNTIKSLPLLRSLTAEDGIPNPSGDPDGDRMEIRPYVPGDSVRNIMWKVYARNRQLNVRLPEKSVFHSSRTVAYLLSSNNDEAAAAIARVALESGALGDDWAFGADGSETPCENVESALNAIAKSRAIEGSYSYGLDKFLTQAAGQSGVHCIVFAGAEFAPWVGMLRQSIARFSGRFSLVLATDGFNETKELRLWQRLLLQNAENSDGTETGGSRADLLKLLAEIGQLVESTVVVDRKTGVGFDQSLRKI